MYSIRKSTKTNLKVFFIYTAILIALATLIYITFSSSGFDLPFNGIVFLIFCVALGIQILVNLIIAFKKLLSKDSSGFGDGIFDIVVLILTIFVPLIIIPAILELIAKIIHLF